MSPRAVALLGLLCACSGSDPVVIDEITTPVANPPPTPLPPGCDSAAAPPTTLSCTGLYLDIVNKDLALHVQSFTPAVPLWSDGAEKHRWIYLPPGTVIDNTNPSEWIFPVGTKLWKEFSRDGRRVETRLWQKVRDGFWVNATYAWNDDETAAVKSRGGDIPLGAGTYHIPTQEECEKCHRGRTEHILGFEQVQLGLAGAQGVTLEDLVGMRLLTNPPPVINLTIGDDGTGAAAPALAWLHANCGTTCHNGNSNATAYGAGMRLRLDPMKLDGRPLVDADPRKTTMDQVVNAPNWNGRVRIVPGDPTASLLYQLISNRGTGNQMPPFASSLVDTEHVPLVADWISKMPPPEPPATGP
jgi:hypothetical protein